LKLLVFGKTGQAATELQRLADVRALDRTEADLENPQACARIIADSDADVIVNAAAFTNVDGAEFEPEKAKFVNCLAPGAMAVAAAKKGRPFLHISTDYVFDGSGQAPWATDARPAPLGAYGRSKLAGEKAVRSAGGKSVILRTSWVFSAHQNNFVKSMLKLGNTRSEVAVVSDQIGGPTSAADIAVALLSIAQQMHDGRAVAGTYHYCGAPYVSWADFAREIFRQADLGAKVCDISSADYPSPARRPANSRLDCNVTETIFGLKQPDWRVSLGQVLQELGA